MPTTTITIAQRVNTDLLHEQIMAAGAGAIRNVAIEAGADWAKATYESDLLEDDPIHAAIAAAIAAHNPLELTAAQQLEQSRITKRDGLPVDVVTLLAQVEAATTLTELKAVVTAALLLAGRLAFVGGIIDADVEAGA